MSKMPIFFIFLLFVFKSSVANINIRQCASCICEGLSQCNGQMFPCTMKGRTNYEVCGPLRITKPYWVEADSPTLRFEKPSDENSFANCVTDFYCAAQTMQQHMAKYQKDCNSDGVIDCDDFLLIHLYGRDRCNGKNVLELGEVNVRTRFLHCKMLVNGLGPEIQPKLNVNVTLDIDVNVKKTPK